MSKKQGKQRIIFANPPIITSTATIGGPIEGQGLLTEYFDQILIDNFNEHTSWENVNHTCWRVIRTAVKKDNSDLSSIDYILAGDLLDQLMSTHFAMRILGRPFLGLYGACSTMAESSLLGAALVDGGFADKVALGVSSHHDSGASVSFSS